MAELPSYLEPKSAETTFSGLPFTDEPSTRAFGGIARSEILYEQQCTVSRSFFETKNNGEKKAVEIVGASV
jgi:hypothetical protein